MSVRALLSAIALLPMMGHASVTTIASCQVRGDGLVNEFKILADSKQFADLRGEANIPIALVESKDFRPVDDLNQLKGVVKLMAARWGNHILAGGEVELPNFSFGKRKPKIAQVRMVVAIERPSRGTTSVNKLVYVVDHQTIEKDLDCTDARD